MYVSYYHILIEVNDHISTIEETRDIEIFDIVELGPCSTLNFIALF